MTEMEAQHDNGDEQAQARMSNPRIWISKYELNLRRVLKYFSKFTNQDVFYHHNYEKSTTTFNNCDDMCDSMTMDKPAVEQKNIKLPLEIQIQILKNLNWKDQCRYARVCKEWRAVVTDWIVPIAYRTEDRTIAPHIINPIFSQVRCKLGSSFIDCQGLVDDNGKPVLDQPLCWPPATKLFVTVEDVRKDGLSPGVDAPITVTSNRCCDRYLRISDLLGALDRHYNRINEDKVITDVSTWISWKFRLETNKFWRRGYLMLHGRWEWKNGGRHLCLYAKKGTGSEWGDD